jgi:hypothetical protein
LFAAGWLTTVARDLSAGTAEGDCLAWAMLRALGRAAQPPLLALGCVQA